MGGAILHDEQYEETCKVINQFKIDNFKSLLSNQNNLTMHASALLNCRDQFNGLPKDMVIRIVKEFYKIISSLPITLIVTAVHKQKLVEKYGELAQDPYLVAWLYCCQRYNKFLQENNEKTGKTTLSERGPGLDKL